MKSVTIDIANRIFAEMKGKKVAVVGDVMLDRYFWGTVSRVSPEAPVPVVDIEEETFHLGGAANVANNLKTLGCEPIMCGSIGNDDSGKIYKKISEDSGIDSRGLYSNPDRPTTVKTRIIGNNQHIVRLDIENRTAISENAENYILKTLDDTKDISALIMADYNKGALTPRLIAEIIKACKKYSLPLFVDPKFENFFNYREVTLIKPNKKEASKALGIEIKSREDVIEAGQLLREKLACKNVLITLGKEGMMLIESDGSNFSVPTIARHISDVSGAGDTAIATLAAAISGKASMKEAAVFANYASGIVCEKPGIVSITPEEIIKAVEKNSY